MEELRNLCEGEEEFDRVRLIWDLTAAPEAPDGRKRLWLKIRKQERWQYGKRERRWPVFVAAAAIVVLAMGGVQLLRTLRFDPEPSVVLVPAGSVTSLELASGIQARANAGSRLSFVQVSPKRVELELEGEAYFEVAGEDGRVLIIRGEAGEVRNTGTRYNVQARDGELVVAVVEGEVVLSAAGEEVVVRSGERSSAVVGAPPAKPSTVDLFVVQAWLDGVLVFRDEPLSRVVARLERHYGVPFEVSPQLGERRLTALIRSKNADDAAQTICIAVGARCKVENGGWKLQGR